MVLCQSCGFKLKTNEEGDGRIEVRRYDRLESRYLQTGDFSALQEMNTEYPIETRTLVEKVLQLGEVNDPKINNKFLMFFQDSVLQNLLSDVEAEYANVDDINKGLNDAFDRLDEMIPDIERPMVYLQITALDQSIIVGENSVGVSLDKYMGPRYPLYKKYYNKQQLSTMKRSNIVPDCLCFYLLSKYPIDNFEQRPQVERDLHVGKIMWIVNKSVRDNIFKGPYVTRIDKYVKQNPGVSIKDMLENDDYAALKNI